MPLYIVKFTVTQERVAIVEASSEENAKVLGDAGNQLGNVLNHEYTESATEVVTKIDEIQYQDA